MEYLNEVLRQPGGIYAAGMFAHNEAHKAIGGMRLPTETQLAELAEWMPDENDPRCWASVEEAQTRVDAGAARDVPAGQAQLQTIRRYQVAWEARRVEQQDREGQAIWTAQHTCDVCGEVNSKVQRDPAFWANMFANDRLVLTQNLKRIPQAHMACMIALSWERARQAAATKVGRKTLAEHAAALLDRLDA